MSGPPDKFLTSEPFAISDGLTLQTESDWEALGAKGTALIQNGQLILGFADITLNAALDTQSPTIHAGFPVDISLTTDSEDSLELDGVQIDLVSVGDGEVEYSTTVDTPALSSGDPVDTTATVSADDFGEHVLRASAANNSVEKRLTITSIGLAVALSTPGETTVDDSLPVELQVENTDRVDASALNFRLYYQDQFSLETIWDTTGQLSPIASGSTLTEQLSVPASGLQTGEFYLSVALWSEQTNPDEPPVGTATSFIVRESDGVNLEIDANWEDVDIGGDTLPGWYSITGDLSVSNSGLQEATDVSATVTAYQDGAAVEMSTNSTSFGGLASGATDGGSGEFALARFTEKGTYTVEVAADAAELSNPVTSQQEIIVSDAPGQSRLNIPPINPPTQEPGTQYQFDVAVEEDSGDPTESLTVTATITDSAGTTVFEQTRADLTEIGGESTTLTFDAGVLDKGEYQLAVTADATNAIEQVSVSEPLFITDNPIDTTVAAADTGFGYETTAAVDVTNRATSDVSSVTVDLNLYNQNGTKMVSTESVDIGTMAAETTETVERTQLIADCGNSNMDCLSGVSNAPGEYQFEAIVDSAGAETSIVETTTFNVPKPVSLTVQPPQIGDGGTNTTYNAVGVDIDNSSETPAENLSVTMTVTDRDSGLVVFDTTKDTLPAPANEQVTVEFDLGQFPHGRYEATATATAKYTDGPTSASTTFAIGPIVDVTQFSIADLGPDEPVGDVDVAIAETTGADSAPNLSAELQIEDTTGQTVATESVSSIPDLQDEMYTATFNVGSVESGDYVGMVTVDGDSLGQPVTATDSFTAASDPIIPTLNPMSDWSMWGVDLEYWSRTHNGYTGYGGFVEDFSFGSESKVSLTYDVQDPMPADSYVLVTRLFTGNSDPNGDPKIHTNSDAAYGQYPGETNWEVFRLNMDSASDAYFEITQYYDAGFNYPTLSAGIHEIVIVPSSVADGKSNEELLTEYGQVN